jgi:hypothetical protein
MHVLAVAIYVGYKRAESEHPQPFSKWFSSAVNSGQLRGSSLNETVRSFFASGSCKK